MTYPSLPGVVASPVHCGTPGCRERAEQVIERSGLTVEAFVAMATRVSGPVGRPDEELTRPRSIRRARGGRSASGPRSARSKLL
ncbi:hypothetical protein ACWEV4_13820 [Streptomyces sp. NPDC003860]